MSTQDFTDRSPSGAEFKYFTLVAGLFVAVLLTSNTLAQKPIQLGPLVLPGGVILFPLSYIFGDILTEVYGYVRTRQVIWIGFLTNGLMALAYRAVIALPPAEFWPNQEAFSLTLGQVPRIVFASLVGYLCGEFVNSYVIAKMKIWTGGRHLWSRIIGSTIAGQAVDTFIFVSVGFFGTWPAKYILISSASLYTIKVAYEVAATPLTYAIVAFLKRADHIDAFDRGTRFSPFEWGIEAKP